MGRLPGTRFAVIVDEAHSSQSGEMTKSLKQVLTSSSLEREDELEIDIEDQLVVEMKWRRPQENVSKFVISPRSKIRAMGSVHRFTSEVEPRVHSFQQRCNLDGAEHVRVEVCPWD